MTYSYMYIVNFHDFSAPVTLSYSTPPSHTETLLPNKFPLGPHPLYFEMSYSITQTDLNLGQFSYLNLLRAVITTICHHTRPVYSSCSAIIGLDIIRARSCVSIWCLKISKTNSAYCLPGSLLKCLTFSLEAVASP